MSKEKRALLLTILMPIVYVVLGIGLVIVLVTNGEYPQGSDTMLHLYKGDVVYRSIGEGQFFPLYDEYWFNGMEPLRTYAPLPAYLLAFLRFIAGGDLLNGYLVFVFCLFFVGAMEWLYIGKKWNRPYLGALFGIFYFFMPYSLFVLFQEGNLARSTVGLFLPVYVYFLVEYMQSGRRKDMLGISLVTITMALCHVGFAGMVSLAAIGYLLFDSLWNRNRKKILALLPVILLSFGIIGFWLVPYLNSGITGWDYAEEMNKYFQDLWISINPLERSESGNAHAYFGLSLLGISVFGGLFGGKKTEGGFWYGVLYLVLTTTTAGALIKVFPGGKFLWMLWLIPLIFVLIYISILRWNQLRAGFVVLFCLLILLDSIPSLPLFIGTGNHTSAEERLDDQWEGTLIAKAKEITKQRMVLIDGSYLESMGAYLASDYKGQTKTTSGYGWRNASTATNVAQLDKGAMGGNYLYLFDRCKELGNDTVLINLSILDLDVAPIETLDAAAERLGYEVVTTSPSYRLYHMETGFSGNWGTVSKYDAIGIGTAASSISLDFPTMEETSSPNLNDYSFEELSKYKMVYLAGFTFDDREKAEDLVLRLSEAGVRVVIAADGIPEDRKTHDQSFLGVVCNTIQFSNGFPEFDTIDGKIDPDLFPRGYQDWKTVYLEGLDTCWASLLDNDVKLQFYGTVKNDNIVMIGLNLCYFYGITKDDGVGGLISHAMNISGEDLPRRKLTPVEIEQDARELVITTREDHVNVALAEQSHFHYENEVSVRNHLLVLEQGETRIQIRYPDPEFGVLVSVLSVGGMVTYFIRLGVYKKKKRKKEKK